MPIWISVGIINLFLILDKIIFNINKYLFEIFFGLTNLKFSDSYLFEKLASRLYVIIGIFMLFKVIFSLIQMVANPDLVTDKEKGAGKLATRIVISLALLVLTPFIFEKAMDLQSAIIEDNIIGQIVLGVGANDTNNLKVQGKNISYQIFKGFVSPNESADKNDQNYKICEENYNTAKSIDRLITPKSNKGINCFTDTTSNGEFPYSYLFGVSTIGSLALAWMVVGFCLDIGIRLIKLGFYQIIAPIPIISYINSSKNGPFDTWVKKCMSTYISVFVKLLTIYFVIYMCNIITGASNGNVSGINFNNIFQNSSVGVKQLAIAIVVLGLIVFAKSAPKLIKTMFGIKDDDEMDTSFGKQLMKAALLGGTAMFAGGASNAAFGIGNAISDFKKGNIKGGFARLGKMPFSAVGGAASGLRHGALNGYANKGANPFSGLGKSVLQTNQARYNRSQMWAASKEDGVGFFKRAVKYYGGTVADIALGRTGLDTSVGNREKMLKNQLSGIQSARNANSQARYEILRQNQALMAKSSELNRFTYDAFNKVWYETDENTGAVKNIGNKTIDQIAAAAGINAGDPLLSDAKAYLDYVQKDAVFSRSEVQINKQLGVVGQVKEKREGNLK